MTQEAQTWRVGGYAIKEYEAAESIEETVFGWANWLITGRKGKVDSRIAGKGYVYPELDLLRLNAWKVRRDSDFKDFKEVSEYLDSLPVWDKTTYYIKFADFGDSGVLDCKTGEPAPQEVHDRVAAVFAKDSEEAEKRGPVLEARP